MKMPIVLRRFGAVGAGLIAVVVLSIGTDVVLHLTQVLPPMGEPMSHPIAALATAYRCVYAVLGSYIAARLAPDRPMAHALWLGGIGLILGTIGAVVTWNAGPAYEPKWFPLALVATAMPCAWVGGKLYGNRNNQPTGV